VYFEYGRNINDVLAREKQLKNGKRSWKIDLIESINPNWDDLSGVSHTPT
jgi:putative endonuclease